MKELTKKIEDLISDEIMRTGSMGTEIVSIRVELTDKEKEDFYSINLPENYNWEFNDNTLFVSYSEEI